VYDAEDVFLLNSHDQELTLDRLVEIRLKKLRKLSMTLRRRPGQFESSLTEAGVKMFENMEQQQQLDQEL
jgi:hypothetical protein